MTASLPAGMAHWTMICFPMGIAAFVNTFVAQYHGAGKPERIGLAVAQGQVDDGDAQVLSSAPGRGVSSRHSAPSRTLPWSVSERRRSSLRTCALAAS